MEGLIEDHFSCWRADWRGLEEDEEAHLTEVSGEAWEGEVINALQGTSNKSAAGPDEISYRFIKAILKSQAGEGGD